MCRHAQYTTDCTTFRRSPPTYFPRRFVEHKGELDNIRIMYARMQAQLDETHKLLHEEHRKRFALEDEVTKLQVGLAGCRRSMAR